MRQDDADYRLTSKAFELGIATKERYDWWKQKEDSISKIIQFCDETSIKPKDINASLERLGTTPIHSSIKISDLIARPQLTMSNLAEVIPHLNEILKDVPNREEEITEAAEIRIKYRGYIERERIIADKMRRLEDIKIKGRFNYAQLHEISTEGRQKLEKIQPETLAEASRIPGVSPSDINVLLILLGR